MRLDSITDSPDPVVSGGVVVYTIRVTNLGPNTAPSVLITVTMPSSDRMLGGANCTGGGGFGQCSIGSLGAGQSATVRPSLQLNGVGSHSINAAVGGGTTDPNTGNNQASQSTQVTSTQRTTDDGGRVLDLLSTLDVRPLDGRIRARITVNDAASEETSNTGIRPHAFRAQPGENRVAAQVQIGESDSGTWRLDFSTTRNFVPGSLRAQSGRVVSQDANSITFALDGETNDLRFTLELSEPTH